MTKFWIGLLGVLAPAAILVAASGASPQVATGDSCTATGNGTAYTLNIDLASGVQQGVFAFGAAEASVTNVNIGGTVGTLSTQGLPSGTTAKWMLNNTISSGGSLVASLTTSAPAKSFTVVPAASPTATAYLAPFRCALATKATLPSNAFSTHGQFTYGAGKWHGRVTVSGPGKVSFGQMFARPSNGLPVKKPRLVISSHLVATKAGTVTINLTPTAAGLAAIKAKGSVSFDLGVTFTPKGGRLATKLVRVTLHR
ncbi:MAG TPA: hypothetical protein VG265_03040 [Gaiellaceae bacterium]|jgi:hypothetical protein|nr:hypothetical protein [Gaiellaceae bacterium]